MAMSSHQPAPPTAPTTTPTDTYAGHSRFTLELEFAQSLSNPYYLHHLALQKYFDDPAFVNYLDYLQYWRRPGYAKFLSYPVVTLRALEMLQVEAFRRDLGKAEVVAALAEGWAGVARGDGEGGEG